MSLHRLSKHCCGSDGCVASAAGESRMKPMYRLEEHAAGAVSVVCDTDASAVTLLTEIKRDKVKTPKGHERHGTDRPEKRVEDHPLLMGKGRSEEEMNVPVALHARFVRSPNAHAINPTIT